MLMLKFAHTQWPALDIVDNLTIWAGATVFHGTQSACSFPFIYKDGIHYGCLWLLTLMLINMLLPTFLVLKYPAGL